MAAGRVYFNGEIIIFQTEVIFTKKRKKKQKPPQRCILYITNGTVALTDPKKSDKTVLSYSRNMLQNYNYNKDVNNDTFKLECIVHVNNKDHTLRFEFPGNDALKVRQTVINYFENDKHKPLNNDDDVDDDDNDIDMATKTATTTDNTPKPTTVNGNKPNNNASNVKSKSKSKSKSSSLVKKRGIKRKHNDMVDEEMLHRRARKLAKHRYLTTLYKQLVGNNVLTASEFWNEYGKDIDIKQNLTGKIKGIDNSVLNNTMDRKTWSLFEVFKQNIINNNNDNDNDNKDNDNKDNANDNNDDINNNNNGKMTVNLTRENIIEIFIHLPEVKLAYERNVPHIYTEKEFWQSFVQSHYFNRKTTKTVTTQNADKDTDMDILLKKYMKQIQIEKSVSPSPGHLGNNKDLHNKNANTFAQQLAVIQNIKNTEVGAKELLSNMKQSIAAKKADDNNPFYNQIQSGNINLINTDKQDININDNGDIQTMDIDNDNDNNNNNNNNKPLPRPKGYKRKLNKLDRSIDLSTTKSSFIHIVDDDPGDINNDNNMSKADVQNWFKEVNQHSTMILGQSYNRYNKNNNNDNDIQEDLTNIPKVNYGQQYAVDMDLNLDNDDHDNDIKMNDKDKSKDNVNVLDMEYEDRLNIETEFSDLYLEEKKNYIELKIKDQSLYWGNNLLLNDKEQHYLNCLSKQLFDYYGLVEKNKKQLSKCRVDQVIHSNIVKTIIERNTSNNYATNQARLQSENRNKNNNNNINGRSRDRELKIYNQTSRGYVIAMPKILSQMSEFTKPMKELVRHYWSCFPADNKRLNKAEIIVKNLKNYQNSILNYSDRLDSKKKSDQKVLLQPLLNLLKKVFNHWNKTQIEYKAKENKRKKIINNNTTITK